MPVFARNPKQSPWEIPEEGVHRAVCCDVIDLGLIDGFFGNAYKVDFRWQVEELTIEGKPMLVTRRFTNSLHEKSNMRPFLEAWRGKKFTDDELEAFDLERLIGANCQLQIMYNIKGDKTFANVTTIMPPVKGVPPLTVRDYIRKAQRPEEEPDEGDLPF